ncbi:MAG: hypothetical protein RLZZ383_1180 [Pseudomonadota bacterium]|jgi:branched-subunit amino acid aminotransferase/4-amino-4-deoxychorismate lyase
MAGWARVNGVLSTLEEARIPVADPGFTLGWTVFETLASLDGVLARWDAHVQRLESSARAMQVPWPGADLLHAEASDVARRVMGETRIRITLTRGGARVVVAEPGDPSRRHRPVVAVSRRVPYEPFVGGTPKHGSRAPWAVGLLESGADEVLMVAPDGTWREGTTSAIVVEQVDALWCVDASADVLASTTLDALSARAAVRGVPWRRGRLVADSPFVALYIASATRDLAPVVALDGRVLTGWGPLGRRLSTEEDGCVRR